MFRKHVTERFSLLENGLSHLAQANWATPLHIEGQDEISLASRVINQLLESKQLSNSALDDIEQRSSPCCTVAIGILMVHDERIVSLNDTALRMLGYEQQTSLLGKPFALLFAQDRPQERFTRSRFNQLLALEPKMVEWEFIVAIQDGASPVNSMSPHWTMRASPPGDLGSRYHGRRNSESKIKRLRLL